jgi:hypothetical protein
MNTYRANQITRSKPKNTKKEPTPSEPALADHNASTVKQTGSTEEEHKRKVLKALYPSARVREGGTL